MVESRILRRSLQLVLSKCQDLLQEAKVTVLVETWFAATLRHAELTRHQDFLGTADFAPVACHQVTERLADLTGVLDNFRYIPTAGQVFKLKYLG